MDAALQAITRALATEASPEARRDGVAACRAILAVLEPSAPNAVAPPAQPAPHVAALVAVLRGMPMEQILDLAIARLRAMVPAGTDVAPASYLKLPIIPIPQKE
jgi:hypothetical protein